jgi:hypothetical protein
MVVGNMNGSRDATGSRDAVLGPYLSFGACTCSPR